MYNPDEIIIYEPDPTYDPHECEEVPLDVPGQQSNPKKRKTTDKNVGSKKSRIQGFSTEEKKALAAAVRDNRCIWDLSDPLHHNHDAVDLAWKRVAAQLVRNGKWHDKFL